MRHIPIFALLLSSLAFGGETLPDEARIDDGEDETEMQERFSAPVMGSDELESLYLQSPVEIGGSPAQGMRSALLALGELRLRQAREAPEGRGNRLAAAVSLARSQSMRDRLG